MKDLYIKPVDKVFVCGGGHQGLSMAAHLGLNGIEVTLWNRTESHIKEIIKTRKINCSGIINGEAEILMASSDIAEVISDFVMVSTPSNAHRDVAKVLAPYVHKDMIIVLNPGRTFGAIDFANTLIQCGIKELPYIAETQTIVYTCRRIGEASTKIIALKNGVKISSLKHGNINEIMGKMPECLRSHFSPVNSVALTSFSNIGMILHCAPVIMNIGWIETEKTDFKYYYEGISKSVADYLEKIDAERIGVAKALGFDVESTTEWLKRTYDVTGNSLYECIQANESYKEIDAPTTVYTRYILEDVPNGLVPIEYLAKTLGISTPNITTIINLVNSVLEIDFREIGRRFPVDLLKEYF